MVSKSNRSPPSHQVVVSPSPISIQISGTSSSTLACYVSYLQRAVLLALVYLPSRHNLVWPASVKGVLPPPQHLSSPLPASAPPPGHHPHPLPPCAGPTLPLFSPPLQTQVTTSSPLPHSPSSPPLSTLLTSLSPPLLPIFFIFSLLTRSPLEHAPPFITSTSSLFLYRSPSSVQHSFCFPLSVSCLCSSVYLVLSAYDVL